MRGAFVLGRAGNDRISGTWLSEYLEGEAGHDLLDGKPDVVDRGSGEDTAIGDRADTGRGCERAHR